MDYYFGIADTCSIHKIVDTSQSYIVNHVNGCWCVLDDENIEFVSELIGNTVYSSSLNIPPKRILLLKKLFFQGILKINDKTCFIEELYKKNEENLTIIINTTNRCNIHCKYCYAYTNETKYADFSTSSIIDDIIKLINKKEDLKLSIVFHGGEPLLCWNNIAEIVVRLDENFKNVSYSIQTNGILLNNKIIDFAKSRNIKIGISLDGANKQSNINRFGEDKNGYFNKIIENINLLTLNDIEIGLLTVVTKDNLRDLQKSLIFFVEKGIKNFGFNFLLSKGRGADYGAEVSINELINVYIEIACYINDYNSLHERKDFISERTISVIIYSLSHKPLGACFTTPCNAGESLLALDVNGDVYPCDEFVGSSDFCIGNVRQAGFSFEENKKEKLIKLRYVSTSLIDKCKQCPVNKLCPFICPSDSFYRTGDLFQPYSMCEFTKLILPKFMHLLQNNIISSNNFIFY